MDHTPTPTFHPLDYTSVLLRRKWWLIVPGAITIVLGTALAFGLPRIYKGVATLGVALPAMSQDIVEGQRSNAPERLRMIQQILFSAPVLERVAREEGMDQELPLPEAAARLRARILAEVERPNPALPPGSIEHFSIAYSGSTPEAAQRVTNRLADAFVEESMRRRGARAGETSSFISGQLLASRSRLDDIEARLAQAKESYMGALPEQTEANVAMVAALQQQLETTNTAIRGEQDRLAIIEGQLEAMIAGIGVEVAPGPGAQPVAVAPAARLSQLERDLALLRRQYTDRHPAVTRLATEIELARADAEAAAARVDPAQASSAPPSLAGDPTYRTLVQNRQSTELRIRALEREDRQIRAAIEEYRDRVEMAPRVEQQLATLQREYDLERDQYAQLSSRLRTAEMDERLVQRNGADQFIVLTYAALPEAPDSPNVPRLLLVTILFALCIGGGLALGREYLDRAIYDTRGLADVGAPVLGEIPRIAQT